LREAPKFVADARDHAAEPLEMLSVVESRG